MKVNPVAKITPWRRKQRNIYPRAGAVGGGAANSARVAKADDSPGSDGGGGGDLSPGDAEHKSRLISQVIDRSIETVHTYIHAAYMFIYIHNSDLAAIFMARRRTKQKINYAHSRLAGLKTARLRPACGMNVRDRPAGRV